MKLAALCLVLAVSASAQPANSAARAEEILKSARAALGAKLSSVQTLSLWGTDRRGPQTSALALTIDFAGRYLKEQSTLSSGGQIERMGGDGAVGGGMPGDDGGPSFSLGLIEGFDGDDYWTRNGSGSGKSHFIETFVRYALALTLSPPSGFPVAFTYGSRLESPQGTVDALEGRGPGDFLIHLYLDAKTRLPATMVYHEGPLEIQLWLNDYRSEDSIRFPHTLLWMADGSPLEEFRIHHFKINPKLRPEKFRR